MTIENQTISMEDVNVKSSKLENIIDEVVTAYNRLQMGTSVNAKEIVRTAKVLDHGEKRLTKEYMKRLDQIKVLQNELDTIREIGDQMGYNFFETEEPEDDESEPEE